MDWFLRYAVLVAGALFIPSILIFGLGFLVDSQAASDGLPKGIMHICVMFALLTIPVALFRAVQFFVERNSKA